VPRRTLADVDILPIFFMRCRSTGVSTCTRSRRASQGCLNTGWSGSAKTCSSNRHAQCASLTPACAKRLRARISTRVIASWARGDLDDDILRENSAQLHIQSRAVIRQDLESIMVRIEAHMRQHGLIPSAA
jgi:hypothetical protein